MITGITFWKILNDEVLRLRLDRLPASLALSWGAPNHPAPVLLSCLLFFMPICFLAFSRLRHLKEDHTRTRIALQALATVIAPTCSFWPSRYIELASVLRSHIDIPLEVIIKDTIDGVTEFRNPIDSLAALIGSGATVNGHTVRITIGWKWWTNYIEWWMLAKSNSDYPSFRSPGSMLGPSDRRHRNTLTVNESPLDLSLNPFALTPSTSYPLLCLDRLPHGIIPSLNAGCKVTLEFTAFSPSLPVLTTAQIISTIPFMISERPRRRPRPLVSVLKQLSASYGPNLVIDSLSNVSVDYERALRRVYNSFSGEQKVRETWVKVLGIRAWRREIFLVALEAALVRRGWIERWAIQVTVK